MEAQSSYRLVPHVRNEGAAFGLLQGRQPLFILISLGVLTGIVVYWWRTRGESRSWVVVVGLGLITGGAIGNLTDRLVTTRVTEFFDAAIINFPVFNVADSAIVIGTGLLILALLFGGGEESTAPSAEEGATQRTNSDTPPADTNAEQPS